MLQSNDYCMIQRIQSVYLLIAGLVSAGLSNVLPTGHDIIGNFDKPYLYEGMLLSGLLSFIIIFIYKNRKFQFVLGRVNIILNFILLSVFVYLSLTLPGEGLISEKGIGQFIPIVAIVLLVLANKSIKKDEQLVKSVDRLR